MPDISYAEFKRWRLKQKRLQKYSPEAKKLKWQSKTRRGTFAKRRLRWVSDPYVSLGIFRSWGIPFRVREGTIACGSMREQRRRISMKVVYVSPGSYSTGWMS